MDNMEMNEIVNTEAVKDMVETTESGSGAGAAFAVGTVMVLGAALWEIVVRPVGMKIGTKVKEAWTNHKTKKAELTNLEGEVPPIDEHPDNE